LTVPDLIERARGLVTTGGRRMLGITGAPAAGKSMLAATLTEALAPGAALVPMDGFHLAAFELHRLGRHDRKGGPTRRTSSTRRSSAARSRSRLRARSPCRARHRS